ncbi:MAG: GDP-mannose 4,6 dehydratase, partial [Candidatus Hydrothermia bacterium]
LAEKGTPGQVYNQGSGRTNSVLSLILLGLNEAGYKVHRMRTTKGTKSMDEPGEMKTISAFGIEFPGTRADEAILFGGLDFVPEDEGLVLETEQGEIRVEFDPDRMRPSDVPILLCDASKAKALGFKVTKTLSEIIKDQINYFLAPENIEAFLK